MAPNLLVPTLFSPLLAFAVWRRVRGQFGRQPVRRGRMLARMLVLALAGVAGLPH